MPGPIIIKHTTKLSKVALFTGLTNFIAHRNVFGHHHINDADRSNCCVSTSYFVVFFSNIGAEKA